MISIHAPLTGSDQKASEDVVAQRISIHAPLTGSDHLEPEESAPTWNFNPRSPYGERLPIAATNTRITYFNPRSPYGERPPMTYNAVDIL